MSVWGFPPILTDSYRFVLERHLKFCVNQNAEIVEIQGVSDLAVDGRKFSGNAQHRKRFCSLFHGTFLLRFDIPLIESCLPHAVEAARLSSQAVLMKLSYAIWASHPTISAALKQAWGADETLHEIPVDRIKTLVRERYSRNEWNFKY